ncbi:MAG: hypothetical protein ABSE64_05785 [Vulcanimicrobiaceae bacterium]|jgi:hypothetical protein
MTWIVGMSTMIGYAIAISDIRVSRGTIERDCLQKVYRVAPGIALGFSGSVMIGLRMVAALTDELVRSSSDLPDPIAVATALPGLARDEFDRSPDQAQEGGCSLMMISAHPFRNRGEAPFPATFLHTFRCPDFEPTEVQTSRIESIGSPSQAESCRRALHEIMRNEERDLGILKSLMTVPQIGAAATLGYELTKLLQESPQAGVSPHLHVCTVTRGRVVVAPNDFVTYDASGPKEFRMPSVARTQIEFNALWSTLASAGDFPIA